MPKRRSSIGDLSSPQRVYLTNSEHKLSIHSQSNVGALQVLWSVATVLFLTIGLFLGFGTNPFAEATLVDWIGGVTTAAAVLIVILALLLNDRQNARQFKGNDENKPGCFVEVLRNGSKQHIDIQEVVVGDVVLLQPGQLVPCDGVFLSGHNVFCDESRMTGHADEIIKMTYDDCIASDRRPASVDHGNSEGDKSQRKMNSFDVELGMEPPDQDCFLVGGCKVLAGTGSYVVTSVGKNCLSGRIITGLTLYPFSH